MGDILVDTFSIPHDAQDPVGFLLRTSAGNIGFLTDLGHTTRLVLERIRPANALVLEANHDVKMLQDCPRRPWSLKQRILGRHGHLSNEAAADAAEQIMSADLRHLISATSAANAIAPNWPTASSATVCRRSERRTCSLELTSQATPCPTLSL